MQKPRLWNTTNITIQGALRKGLLYKKNKHIEIKTYTSIEYVKNIMIESQFLGFIPMWGVILLLEKVRNKMWSRCEIKYIIIAHTTWKSNLTCLSSMTMFHDN